MLLRCAAHASAQQMCCCCCCPPPDLQLLLKELYSFPKALLFDQAIHSLRDLTLWDGSAVAVQCRHHAALAVHVAMLQRLNRYLCHQTCSCSTSRPVNLSAAKFPSQ